MREQLCDFDAPHKFHAHEAEVTYVCSGSTLCGQSVHKGHEYVVKEQVWCRGICRCGTIPEPHGPGEHK